MTTHGRTFKLGMIFNVTSHQNQAIEKKRRVSLTISAQLGSFKGVLFSHDLI